jgi:hypothetical protein
MGHGSSIEPILFWALSSAGDIVAIAAVLYLLKGMEPQRERQTLSQEEIYKQMQGFNQRLAGSQRGGASAPSASGAPGSAAAGTAGK